MTSPASHTIMDLNNIPSAFKNAIGTHEVFRKLGFSPDEINWHMNPDGQFFCVLEAQGKTFAVTVGFLDVKKHTPAEWQGEFRQLTEAVNKQEVDEETMYSWYFNCEAFRRKVDFLTAMWAKGITPPKELPN